MTMIVCYSKCWPCTYAEDYSQHDPMPHTWMDDEDLEHAKATKQVPEDVTREQLAVSHPCGCWCVKREAPNAPAS